MRTAGQIAMAVGMWSAAFGVLGLFTEWGQRQFAGAAGTAPGYALPAGLVLLFGGAILKMLAGAARRRETPARRAGLPARRNVDEGRPLCPNCLAVNEPLAHFCRKCGTPMTAHAEIDPLGRIYAMGDTYWKATRRPSSPMVLIGMWLILGVPAFMLLALLPVVLFEGYGISIGEVILWRILAMLVILALIGVYAAVLVKATKNYVRRRNPKTNGAAEPDGPES